MGRTAGKRDKKSIPPESGINIALAGNPNVGKSTVFNALTGMKQHTGNWTGKTVATARGRCTMWREDIILTDLPGTYSLMAHSAEEQVACDYICFSDSKGVIVVCDGSCLERNLNLVLQVLEITPHVTVCVNLMDEAAKKKIEVDLSELERLLGVPVCGTAARSGRGLREMLDRTDEMLANSTLPPPVIYEEPVERALAVLSPALEALLCGRIPARFAALRILEHDESIVKTIDANTCGALSASISDKSSDIGKAYRRAVRILRDSGTDTAELRDSVVTEIVLTAERIAERCVRRSPDSGRRDRQIDRILTHRIWGIPLMLAVLTLIFYITLRGANYPSGLLLNAFSSLGAHLRQWLADIKTPPMIASALIDGVYTVLTWVASVMLPPMAIFFVMFTLLEDVGYLPRAAFNLDRFFSRSGACGKQALTMAMGLGCNAAGITGCRIIDSPRERIIAILTNNFMPCNGRFPILIVLSAAFFAAGASGNGVSALTLTCVLMLGGILTFVMSRILSSTLLKGVPASFALELPPYRRPRIGKVIIRSLLDRTVFVLGRAAVSAAPAGLLIWLLANIPAGDVSLLVCLADVLDPAGRLIGMDGAILLAFILGFPANEIVLPILLMIYTHGTALTEYPAAAELGTILSSYGWTPVTAVCVMIFTLCHFPCATSCLTVRKETGSWKWTIAAFIIPTLTGALLCVLTAGVSRLFYV